jgi:hypothetical protein
MAFTCAISAPQMKKIMNHALDRLYTLSRNFLLNIISAHMSLIFGCSSCSLLSISLHITSDANAEFGLRRLLL